MDELATRVRTTLLSSRLTRAGERVLIGVSGGPDSVALLHILTSLRAELRVQLSVVHVDHRLRPDSSHDGAFVAALAGCLAVPATIVERDVLADASTQGRSLEDRARRMRYQVFLEVARQQAASRVALAHTADDQAETVLMRVIRGAGLRGLTAIPLSRPLGEVMVIRPLLAVWRQELLEYLKRHRLEFRHDATNNDLRFLRNRIRAQLLPLLEREYNPNMKALLCQLAEQCRTDTAFLQDAAQRHWKRLVKSHNGGLIIRVEGFLKQPTSLQRQLVRQAIQHLQGDVARFEFRHWREIERLFTERPVGTVLDLPGKLRLERERDRVSVHVLAQPQGHTPLD